MSENDKKREAGVALHTCDKSRYPPGVGGAPFRGGGEAPSREAGVALEPLKKSLVSTPSANVDENRRC